LSFVLDSSLAMAFVFLDEATAHTDEILDSLGQGTDAVTPALWRWEVGNALLMAERRKRITSGETRRHFSSLEMLAVAIDEQAPHEAWNAAFHLARTHGLTLYDASYLELAIRQGVALGSLDAKLRRAARAEGVKVLPERP
jgi:predicted nucleic acid-binding protein